MKFVGRKELEFISRITSELVQKIIGQEVIYYQILKESTPTNDLYEEAIVKVHAAPVLVNALIMFENPSESVLDSKFKVDVYFHTRELLDRNLAPKSGDFVQFGDVMYEIYSTTQPQIAFGMIDQKVMTHCSCGPARQGQFMPKKVSTPQPPHFDKNAPKYTG